MPLPPSRRDITGPPPRDASDLASLIRHQGSYLRSLDPGILGGRFATPRPPGRGPSPIVGGNEDGGDGTTYEWQWDDRYTVTATGTQTPTLTYEPVEESLFVRWHPAGRGGLPLTSDLFSVNGRVVTIPDPGLVVVGDQFSFQYQFDPGVEEATDAFESLALVGVTTYYGVSPQPTSFTLPVGTSVGDLIVFGAIGSSSIVMTDSRMTQIQPSVWVGRADSLAALQVTSAGLYWSAIVGTFAANSDPVTSAQNTGGVTSIALPIVSGSGGIAVVLSAYSGVDGQADPVDAPWIGAGNTGTGKASCRIAYWSDLTQPTTPAGSSSLGSAVSSSATVLGFGA